MNKLKYSSPGRKWEDALPVGNGRLGAMVYGGVRSEIIQLNEISLWSGEPFPSADRKDAYKYLPIIRRLIDEENYDEAQKLTDAHMTNYGGGFYGAYSGSYQTLGELRLIHNSIFEKPCDYSRTLDLESAVAAVTYRIGATVYTREVFSSAPSQAVFIRFTASNPGSISITLSYERKYLDIKKAVNNEIVFGGYSDGNSAHMRFDGRIKAVNQGGSVTCSGKKLIITQADSVTLIIAARTDYILSQENRFKGVNPTEQVIKDISNAGEHGYEFQKFAHINEYRSFYGRCSVTFGTDGKDELDTDCRLKEFLKNGHDKSLCELFFQFGRYLLISSSRPDNILPANLQGMWCRDYKAPWHCDYHSNINIQMNYWPAGPANLADCTQPLANLICALPENGRKTAKEYYNAEGWTLYTITNPWLWTSPGWGGGWSQYPLGGAWMCRHLWEYYAYTGDKTLLASFYPTMRENCLFNMSILVENEKGDLYTNPATSPENNFRDENGNVGWLTKGTAMDIEVLYDNFTYMIETCRILDVDSELAEQLKSCRERLKKLKIGKSGQLCEWGEDWDLNAPEMNHRHVSHLYGLHPGNMISRENTPELVNAAEKSLELRGDEGTGWSLAWKINFYARLNNGNKAYKLLSRLLRPVGMRKNNYTMGGGVYKNLFDAHPPFQIDGNFGALSGICEMLLQSHETTEDGRFIINILPALPDEFPNGSVRGLLSRGNIETDIDWKNGMTEAAALRPAFDTDIAVKGHYIVSCGEKEVNASYKNGLTLFAARAGEQYRLSAAKLLQT